MATTSARSARAPDYDSRGDGWITFAGIMIGLVGVINVIYGIAAISNSKFYFHNVEYVFSDLKTYGWIATIIGATQLAAAFGIFSRSGWARWVGIITAGCNVVLQLVYISAYPLAALAIMAIDILIIYGLVAYGGRSQAAF